MPLTTYALDRDVVLDASRGEGDVGGGLSWAQLLVDKPPMECRECREAMYAKGGESKSVRAHFAHKKRSPSCPSNYESADHLELKRRCAEWIREAGWRAHLEYSGPGGEWRADVLAEDPQSGRRVAFEIQLSAQTAEQARHRTERYRDAGIECVWIAEQQRVRSKRAWFRSEGALVVAKNGGEDSPAAATWEVVEGCARWRVVAEGAFRTYGCWMPSMKSDIPLSATVQWITAGRIVPSRPDSHAAERDWWWVYANERAAAEAAGEYETRDEKTRREQEWRARQRVLRAAATAAAKNRWPGLPDTKIDRARPDERSSQDNLLVFDDVNGEMVAIRFGNGKSKGGRKESGPGAVNFALLLPDVIVEHELTIPVLADNWEAAEKIARRYPSVRVTVPDGAAPWTVYRYRDEAWRPAGQFGKQSKRTSATPAERPKTPAEDPGSVPVSAAAATASSTSPQEPASPPAQAPPPPVQTPSPAAPRPSVRPTLRRRSPVDVFVSPWPWAWCRRAALALALACLVLAGLLAAVTGAGLGDLVLLIGGIEVGLGVVVLAIRAWLRRL